jgi:ferric-dicitrate binding protein FerR (iron transport regulator)
MPASSVSHQESSHVAYRQNSSLRLRSRAVVVAFFAACLFPARGQAQSDACTLRPDKFNPNEQVLRCGEELTVRPASGTVYHPVAGKPGQLPASVQLDGGALLIKFHPTAQPGDFQILTPQAIASVRGTTWAVEVKPGLTSVFVEAGAVAVTRTKAAATVVLRQGQGVDVDSRGGPLQVKRWKPARVKALLARFPQ